MYDRIGHLNAVLYSPNKKAQLDAYTAWIASADEEITRLRARLEQAERERDKGDYYEGIEEGYKSGFRAGIEAAAKHLESDCPNWRDDIRWAVSDTVDEIRALAAQKGDE